ncbi:MAG: 3'-phosphoesterase [Candidatus Aenigmarchaeota archaeon]|nr:3'-phosphoesterase [Candidatus Aenigmarchaeota archaeon]
MPVFVVHEHNASRLHWDLRLEMDGVLKSWAVPKEPPLEANVKRLAIQVDDHALSYGKFEGVIKEGYGAGTVKIWDNGTYEIVDKKPDKIVFKISGRKMRGEYVLLKFKKADEKEWLLFRKE